MNTSLTQRSSINSNSSEVLDIHQLGSNLGSNFRYSGLNIERTFGTTVGSFLFVHISSVRLTTVYPSKEVPRNSMLYMGEVLAL